MPWGRLLPRPAAFLPAFSQPDADAVGVDDDNRHRLYPAAAAAASSLAGASRLLGLLPLARTGAEAEADAAQGNDGVVADGDGLTDDTSGAEDLFDLAQGCFQDLLQSFHDSSFLKSMVNGVSP
jgi:hypothetical protein